MTSDALARLLTELVAIESPSGSEGDLAEFVAARLAAAGCDVVRLGHSVLACIGAGSGPRILFNSHLDTVPVGEGWTHKPSGGDWQDGRLYGRGSNDAKASVAAMLATFETLAREGGGARAELLLALTATEETSNQGMLQVVEYLGLDSLAGAVTGEPTGLEVVRAQSGLAVLRASWTGRSCHAAHVARVAHDNALLRAAEEIGRTGPYLLLDEPHALLGPSTIAPTVLHAGTRHNVVPDRAEALFDARLAPPHDGAAACRLLASRMPTARLEIHSERLRPVETAAAHPLVQAALAAAGRKEAIGSSTLSDMALLVGVPAVKCGPGQTARSHTPDEFVLRDELEAGYAFYRSFASLATEALAAAASA